MNNSQQALETRLFSGDVGLFSGDVGLFSGDVGLFSSDVGLVAGVFSADHLLKTGVFLGNFTGILLKWGSAARCSILIWNTV